MDKPGVLLPSPLYRDPVCDGPTDPAVIWNREEKCWWMLYTQRRSLGLNLGVSSVHGTGIGVASSADGARWLYRGTLPGLDFEPGHNTFWAPEVIWAGGKYHMYVSYITGVPQDWNWPRHIVHYTADSLWHWRFESVLPLSSDRVIDACVYEIASGHYKMWYKDEDHGSHTYSAQSKDLYHWDVTGPEITDCPHEGPNVFELDKKRWMITDCWDGLAVYETEDFVHWTRQDGNLLQSPGTRPGDGAIGNHADVLVTGGRAYIYYFTHPEFPPELRTSPGFVMTVREARTVIQAAELRVMDGRLCCDRNAPVLFCTERT